MNIKIKSTKPSPIEFCILKVGTVFRCQKGTTNYYLKTEDVYDGSPNAFNLTEKKPVRFGISEPVLILDAELIIAD